MLPGLTDEHWTGRKRIWLTDNIFPLNWKIFWNNIFTSLLENIFTCFPPGDSEMISSLTRCPTAAPRARYSWGWEWWAQCRLPRAAATTWTAWTSSLTASGGAARLAGPTRTTTSRRRRRRWWRWRRRTSCLSPPRWRLSTAGVPEPGPAQSPVSPACPPTTRPWRGPGLRRKSSPSSQTPPSPPPPRPRSPPSRPRCLSRPGSGCLSTRRSSRPSLSRPLNLRRLSGRSWRTVTVSDVIGCGLI